MDSTLQVTDISYLFGTPQRHGGAFQVCSTPLDGYCNLESVYESDEDNESFLRTLDEFINSCSTAPVNSSGTSGAADDDDATLKIDLEEEGDFLPTQKIKARKLFFVRECLDSSSHDAVERNTEAGRTVNDDDIGRGGRLTEEGCCESTQLDPIVDGDVEVGSTEKPAAHVQPVPRIEHDNCGSTATGNELHHVKAETHVPATLAAVDQEVSVVDTASLVVPDSQAPGLKTSSIELAKPADDEKCDSSDAVCIQSIADEASFVVVDEVACCADSTDNGESDNHNADKKLTGTCLYDNTAARLADEEIDNITCSEIESVKPSSTSSVDCSSRSTVLCDAAEATRETVQPHDVGLYVGPPIAVVSPVRQRDDSRSSPMNLEPTLLEGQHNADFGKDVPAVDVDDTRATEASCTVGEVNAAAAAVDDTKDTTQNCLLTKGNDTNKSINPDGHHVSHEICSSDLPNCVSGDLIGQWEAFEEKRVANSDKPSLASYITTATSVEVSKPPEESSSKMNTRDCSVDWATDNSIVARIPTPGKPKPHTTTYEQKSDGNSCTGEIGTDLMCGNSMSAAGVPDLHEVVKGTTILVPEGNMDHATSFHVDMARENSVVASITTPEKCRKYVTFEKPSHHERCAKSLHKDIVADVSAPCGQHQSYKPTVGIITKEEKGEDVKINLSANEWPNKNVLTNFLRASQGKPTSEVIQPTLEQESKNVGGLWPQDRGVERPRFKLTHLYTDRSTRNLFQNTNTAWKTEGYETAGKETQDKDSKVALHHQPLQKDSSSRWLFHSKQEERTTQKVKTEEGRSQARTNGETTHDKQDGEGDILLVTLESDDVRVVEGDAVDDTNTAKPFDNDWTQTHGPPVVAPIKAEPECMPLVEGAANSTDLRHKINSMRSTATNHTDNQSAEVTVTWNKPQIPLDTNQNVANIKTHTPVETEFPLSDNLKEVERLVPVKLELAEEPPLQSSEAADVLSSVPPRPPFHSEDPEENYDNANPGWENIRQLSNDEERYKAVRNVWHNNRVPDPHRNLSQYRHKQRQLQEQQERTKMRTRRQKRKAPSSSIENPAAKRKRLDTDIFDLKLKELERKTNKDYNAAQHWLELNIQRVREQVNSQLAFLNCGGHHRAASAPWDMRYWQQHQEELLHYKYMTDTQNIRNKYSVRASKLLDARHEVRHFNKFYVGLCGSDPTMLSEHQMKEQLAIEKLLGHFKMYYLEVKG